MVFVRLILRLVFPSLADGLTVTTLLSGACLVFSCSVPTMGQRPGASGWEWQNPLPQGNTINCVRFASDKRHGWAVGSDGTILRTRDGGFEWDSQLSPATTTLYGLYVQDKSRAVISGARGVIMTTTNSGGKWTARTTGTRDHLFAVTFAPGDPLHGWAVGSFGALIATADGGITWKIQNTHTSAHLFSVAFFDAKSGLAVGSARHTAGNHERRRRMAAAQRPRQCLVNRSLFCFRQTRSCRRLPGDHTANRRRRRHLAALEFVRLNRSVFCVLRG